MLFRSHPAEYSLVSGVNVFAASNLRPELKNVLAQAAFFESRAAASAPRTCRRTHPRNDFPCEIVFHYKLLVRRIDGDPPLWLSFPAIVIPEHGRNLVTHPIHDPQVNIRRKLVHDFYVNFSVAYTVPERILWWITNSPNIRATETERVKRLFP